jgi:hypothetical protein
MKKRQAYTNEFRLEAVRLLERELGADHIFALI